MFVLKGVTTNAEIREQTEIDRVVSVLENNGFKPVIRSMIKGAAESLEIEQRATKIFDFISERRIYRSVHPRKGPVVIFFIKIIIFIFFIPPEDI